MRVGIAMGVATLALLAGCADQPSVGAPVAGGRVAVATLRTAAGKDVGRATVREVAGGLRVTVDARFLQPGMHGAHLHTVGRCEGPDFASAGPHWNPTNMKHGSMNPQGPHEGDLPNLTIGADGRGTMGVNIAGASFDALLDADGAAMVVHASADDMMTDPSGNSGGRIACGVLVAGYARLGESILVEPCDPTAAILRLSDRTGRSTGNNPTYVNKHSKIMCHIGHIATRGDCDGDRGQLIPTAGKLFALACRSWRGRGLQ